MQMAERKVFAITSGMFNCKYSYVGSGFNLTQDWYEIHSQWVNSREEYHWILAHLDNCGKVAWVEEQGCTFRSNASKEYRVRIRVPHLDDALLIKLTV